MRAANPTFRDGRIRVVVATTVLLSFISFWHAVAIVLSDLGSTAVYIGGIVEQAVGNRTSHPAELPTRLVVYTRGGRARTYALGAHATARLRQQIGGS